eukprot:9327230-Pyramimonas_sp.AAC.1
MEKLADFPQWTEEVKSKFRVVCAGHLLFREFNGCPDERANITWKAGWPPSAVEYLAFIEDTLGSKKCWVSIVLCVFGLRMLSGLSGLMFQKLSGLMFQRFSGLMFQRALDRYFDVVANN